MVNAYNKKSITTSRVLLFLIGYINLPYLKEERHGVEFSKLTQQKIKMINLTADKTLTAVNI